MRHLLWLAPAVVLFSMAGCRNSCQSICVEMRAYAQECGYTVSDAEFDACLDGQKGKNSRDDRAICRQFNDADALRSEWSCDDFADYWS